MRRSVPGKLICYLLSFGLLCVILPATDVWAKQAKTGDDKPKQQQQSFTPAEAASKARRKHGGKVLKVSPKGKGYQVKLLTDSGRVVTVTVKD